MVGLLLFGSSSDRQDIRLHHVDLLKLVDNHPTSTEWRFSRPGQRVVPGLNADSE